MHTNRKKAFTIIELLVVVSIIALLIGILLPAIGKARDQAHTTRSMANLRQFATAHATYGAEWNDNQWTTAPHNLAAYGTSLSDAVANYKAAFGGSPKGVAFDPTTGFGAARLGFANDPSTGDLTEHFWYDEAHTTHGALLPINFEKGPNTNRHFGYYRMINSKGFNGYMGGRVYDHTFFAPKDRVVITAIGECWDAPGEYCLLNEPKWGAISSSYILSPVALVSPDLMSQPMVTMGGPNGLWSMSGSLRTPNFSQARHPELKTHMLEHHWLQRTRRECMSSPNSFIAEYDDCAPHFFNGARDSVPATLFYDGHVEMLGVREAIQANAQAVAACNGDPTCSLWHNKTPFTGGYYATAPYLYHPAGTSFTPTNFHILTRHGIFGRDTFAR